MNHIQIVTPDLYSDKVIIKSPRTNFCIKNIPSINLEAFKIIKTRSLLIKIPLVSKDINYPFILSVSDLFVSEFLMIFSFNILLTFLGRVVVGKNFLIEITKRHLGSPKSKAICENRFRIIAKDKSSIFRVYNFFINLPIFS